MTNLGALGGIESLAWAINNRSQVAGEFTFVDPSGSGISHAFLWEDGVMQDLGTVPGDQGSIAYAIDDQGRVVGGSGSGFIDAFGTAHAFLWQNGSITDLNTAIPANAGLQLIVAFGINARGQIVACGVEVDTSNVHAILLTPRRGGGVTRMQEETNTRPHVTLSPNARRLLRLATPGRLKSGR